MDETTTDTTPGVSQPLRPFLDARPAIVCAAVLAVGAAFLPWVAVPGASSHALEIPLALLWDHAATEGGASLAVVLLPVAGLALVAALAPRASAARRLAGVLLTALAVAVIVQLWIGLGEASVAADLLGYLGAGLVLTLVSGVVLTFGGR